MSQKKLTVSAAALVAVLGGFQAAGAADLGGNCCADLEERIAELEATTARKGNRKVSLTVSGQVNEAVLAWDDGVERNAYITTNEQSRSRFRFLGSAKIDAKWSAGYLLEIGVRGNKQNDLNQGVSSSGKGLDVRHSAWWLENKDLGRVWVGQTSIATDGITEINLANVTHFNLGGQIGDYIGAFNLRGSNGVLTGSNVTNLIGGGNPGEPTRYNVVKYETPTIAGFIGSASFGEDNFWDVALRYAGEFSGFKLAAGIGYADWNDATSNPRNCTRKAGSGTGAPCNELGMSGTIMHVETGLYAFGGYGRKNDDLRTQLTGFAGTSKSDEYYIVQGGIEKAFTPLGKTTIYGEYYQGTFGAAVNGGTGSGGTSTVRTLGAGAAALGLTTGVNSTDVGMWGVGFNQNVANAALDLYVTYRNYSFDVKDTAGNKAAVNDLQTVVMGARIQF